MIKNAYCFKCDEHMELKELDTIVFKNETEKVGDVLICPHCGKFETLAFIKEIE